MKNECYCTFEYEAAVGGSDLRRSCTVSSSLHDLAKNGVDDRQRTNIPARNKRFNVNIIFRLWHTHLIEKWRYSHKKISICFSESQKNITLTIPEYENPTQSEAPSRIDYEREIVWGGDNSGVCSSLWGTLILILQLDGLVEFIEEEHFLDIVYDKRKLYQLCLQVFVTT